MYTSNRCFTIFIVLYIYKIYFAIYAVTPGGYILRIERKLYKLQFISSEFAREIHGVLCFDISKCCIVITDWECRPIPFNFATTTSEKVLIKNHLFCCW